MNHWSALRPLEQIQLRRLEAAATSRQDAGAPEET